MIGKLPLYGMLALGGLLFISTGYAYVERERRQAAELRVSTLEKQVESRDRAMEALQSEVRAAQARARQFERVRRDVVAASDSRACADSPAVRAAVRGLFPGSTGAPGHPGGADGASRPAGAAR